MPTLADHIKALHLKMLEAEEEEKALVDTLGQRLAEADASVADALRQLIADQEHRRSSISQLIATLATRVGHLPHTAPPHLPHRTPGRDYSGGPALAASSLAGGVH